MLVDRYPPADLFALVPKLMAEFEPVLRTLDRLLDDDTLFQRVKADLARRAPHSLTLGRPGARRSRSSCACSWSSACTAGATGRSSASSATAWCCASSAGSISSPCRMTPPCCAGPT